MVHCIRDHTEPQLLVLIRFHCDCFCTSKSFAKVHELFYHQCTSWEQKIQTSLMYFAPSLGSSFHLPRAGFPGPWNWDNNYICHYVRGQCCVQGVCSVIQKSVSGALLSLANWREAFQILFPSLWLPSALGLYPRTEFPWNIPRNSKPLSACWFSSLPDPSRLWPCL